MRSVAKPIFPSLSRLGQWLAVALAWSSIALADDLSLNNAVLTITSDELGRHVDVLADDSFEGREAGSRGGNAAAGYLVRQLQKMGLKGGAANGSFFQPFGNGYRNVLALLPGTDPTVGKEIILIGAHYDHVGYGSSTNSFGPTGYIHNGADDNASGTAGILEVAQAFSSMPAPRRSILFAFWDGEEKGLLGSKHWANQPTSPLSRLKLAINLDMIGRLRGRGLEVYGTRTAKGLRRFIAEQNVESTRLDFKWEMKGNSDHYTFYVRSVPSVMFHSGLHDNYHRPSDDAHLINKAGMETVSRLVFRFAANLANTDKIHSFRTQSRREGEYARGQMERPIGNPRPRLGVRWSDYDAESKSLPVVLVTRGSAADQGGIRPGDKMLKFNDQAIEDGESFRRMVLASPKEATVEVMRGEETKSLTLKLNGNPIRLGIAWRVDAAEPNSAILTRVTPGARAAMAGLRTGDRIYRIGGQTFNDSNELLKLALESPLPLDVQYERQGRLGKVTIKEDAE